MLGCFVLADERGQIFKMSLTNNKYQSIRLASIPVSAMAFIPNLKHHLVIGYENCVVIVMDTNTKEIVGNIQQKNPSPARIIKCHPTLPLLILVADDGFIGLWDLT